MASAAANQAAPPADETDRLGVSTPESRLEWLWYLRSIPYSEYLQTQWWAKRRADYLSARVARNLDTVCDCCTQVSDIYITEKGRREGLPRFHVHHLTYENLGQEPDEDLALVCSPCHNLIHRPDSPAARFFVVHMDTLIPDLAARAIHMRPISPELA